MSVGKLYDIKKVVCLQFTYVGVHGELRRLKMMEFCVKFPWPSVVDIKNLSSETFQEPLGDDLGVVLVVVGIGLD